MTVDSFPPVGCRRGFPPSSAPLEAVRVAWEWLCARPHPVAIDGTAIVGLPDRAVPLDELRARLLSRGCSAATRDAVWAHLVRRARTEGGTWTVAAAGMALPVLVRVARILTARFANDPSDIHAAVVAGFLHGLTRVDPDRPAVLVSLRWAAYRGGLAAVRDALRAPVPVGQRSYESSPPHPPAGHPDLVLARAVADQVITAEEAALIGSTRLEHVRLADAAAARGQTYAATNTARYRAERRLLAYLTTPDPTPRPASPDPTGPATGTAAPSTPDRPTNPRTRTAAGPGQTGPMRRRRTRNDTRRRTRSVTATMGITVAGVSEADSSDTPMSAPASVQADGDHGRRSGVPGGASTGTHPGSTRPAGPVVGQPTTGRARRPRRRPVSPEQPSTRLLRSSDPLSEPAAAAGVLQRHRSRPAGAGPAPNPASNPVSAAPPQQPPATHQPADSDLGLRRSRTDHAAGGGQPRPSSRGHRRATRAAGPPGTTRTTPATGQRTDAEPS